MAITSRIIKERRKRRKFLESLSGNKNLRFSTRLRRRCNRCGRPRGVMRYFKMCRICIRELADRGELPGVQKSSW